MKKLIYISHWRFPSDKTMSPLIMKTCEGLALLGNSVELWTPRRINRQYGDENPFLHYSIKPIFEIRKLPVLDLMQYIPGTLSFMLMTLTFAISVWWNSRSVDKNAVWYAHDIRDLLFLRRKNVFVEVHDFYESSIDFLNRNVLKRVRGLVVTNKIKMDHLEEKYSISKERMLHMPNAVDIERFDSRLSRDLARAKLSLPPDKKIAVYTGSLFEWKGIHTLALASKHLPEDVLIYFAGGNEEDRHSFKKFIDDNKLPNITLLPLPYEDFELSPAFMRAADALILPNTAKDPASKYETSPVKLFEYMSSGTPIVASDLPSIRNVVSEREVFFFEPDNPKDLAKKIQEVLIKREEGEQRARFARQEVARYSWEEKSKAIVKFIEYALK